MKNKKDQNKRDFTSVLDKECKTDRPRDREGVSWTREKKERRKKGKKNGNMCKK